MAVIAGYDDEQIANATLIIDAAFEFGLDNHAALLGVMCAMGESSLRNIDYGDWETSGVRNPDGSPTTSIGLFQQQNSWGTPAERMRPKTAATFFYRRLVNVRGWRELEPTIAIHRVQINADPYHYRRYQPAAQAIVNAYARKEGGMGGSPQIVWIRDGVGFAWDAANSFRRAEASWGSWIPCNSTYRDYGLQLSMYQAWTAYAEGWGPYPGHSRALHPDESVHCQGRALDTDMWTVAGFIAHMADHGWIRTAASDPTERHHFEYQWWNDNHRNEPAPAGQEDDMPTAEEVRGIVASELKNWVGYPSSGYSRVEIIDKNTADVSNRILARKSDGSLKGWDWFQDFDGQFKTLIGLVTKLAAGDEVDVTGELAQMEARLEKSFSSQLELMRQSLGAEVVAEVLAGLDDSDGATKEEVREVVVAALGRLQIGVSTTP